MRWILETSHISRVRAVRLNGTAEAGISPTFNSWMTGQIVALGRLESQVGPRRRKRMNSRCGEWVKMP